MSWLVPLGDAMFVTGSTSAIAMMAGSISSDTRFITLMSGLRAGPAVSLKGSPTVSAMTAAR